MIKVQRKSKQIWLVVVYLLAKSYIFEIIHNKKHAEREHKEDGIFSNEIQWVIGERKASSVK